LISNTAVEANTFFIVQTKADENIPHQKYAYNSIKPALAPYVH
jgi:hypothetical protein